MWKTTVEKDVENVDEFVLCKLNKKVNDRLYAKHKPSPGGKVARVAGRKRNSGDNLQCGTGKDLLICFVWPSLFLRTSFSISARIPLQPQCAHWGSFPSGEAFWALPRQHRKR